MPQTCKRNLKFSVFPKITKGILKQDTYSWATTFPRPGSQYNIKSQVSYSGILFKGFVRVSLNIHCITWFSMPRWSVAKWKGHNMASSSSLDNVAMFITKATAIVANICHLLKDTSSGWKIKVTRKSHNLGFLLCSIWKCDFNSCYIKKYNNFKLLLLWTTPLYRPNSYLKELSITEFLSLSLGVISINKLLKS